MLTAHHQSPLALNPYYVLNVSSVMLLGLLARMRCHMQPWYLCGILYIVKLMHVVCVCSRCIKTSCCTCCFLSLQVSSAAIGKWLWYIHVTGVYIWIYTHIAVYQQAGFKSISCISNITNIIKIGWIIIAINTALDTIFNRYRFLSFPERIELTLEKLLNTA